MINDTNSSLINFCKLRLNFLLVLCLFSVITGLPLNFSQSFWFEGNYDCGLSMQKDNHKLEEALSVYLWVDNFFKK